jgi:membrane protease YdiL (CAAX protease family)
MRTEEKTISLNRQFRNCALMCGLAVAVVLDFHNPPYVHQLLAGLPLLYQALLGVAIGGFFWAASVIGYKRTANSESTHITVESYSRLDLSGWNPLWIALTAGFGEELLFRGALQPLLGVWFTSILFVVLHARAYRFTSFSKRVLVQASGLLVVSVTLGFIAKYAGLITAMIVHAAIDIVGLYTIRRVVRLQASAAA